MTNSGTAEVIVAAIVESTCRSAQVMRKNGMATLNAPSTARWPYIRGLRGSGSRWAATTAARTASPISRRRLTSTNGVSPASTPILMKM